MIFPVRCFTCLKVIGHLYDEYIEKVNEGKEPKEILDDLGFNRYCCRRMFLSHVEILDEVLKYKS